MSGRPLLCEPEKKEEIDFTILNTDILPALQEYSIYWRLADADAEENKGEIARKATNAFLNALNVPLSDIPDWFTDMRDEEVRKAVQEGRDVNYAFLNDAFKRFVQDSRYERYDDPEQKFKMFEAVNTGFIDAVGDPFAAYITPEQIKAGALDHSGTFYGIGSSLGPNKNNEWELQNIFEGGPADSSGLVQDHDVIVAVDGKSVKGCLAGNISGAIKGPEGTAVTLTLKRNGKEFDARLTRGKVRMELVESWPAFNWPDGRGSTNKTLQYLFPLQDRVGNSAPNIAYVQIKSFEVQTAQDLHFVLKSMPWERIEGLVVDLRGNGGGLVSSVAAISSYFLDSGDVLMKQEDASGRTKILRIPSMEVSDSSGMTYSANLVPAEIPVVILVDRGSASGSEVMAAALQEHERATLIGIRTAGKGTVNNFFPIRRGEYGAMYIAIELWRTPNGKFIEPTFESEEGGLPPDYIVEQRNPSPDNDEYIFKAIEVLRDQTRAK